MACASAWSTLRWRLAGVASACSIALMAAVPALAEPVVPSESSTAVVLTGAVAPDVTAAGYPAANDAARPRSTTPDRRLTITVDGWVLGVACLDLCGATLPGDYSIAPEVQQNPAVVRVVAAARASSAGLTDPAEVAAVQAAIWFVTAGFVLDAEADPAIRQRVADLVAASVDQVNQVVVTPVGAVLVAEPGAPRLVVTEAAAAELFGGRPGEAGMIAALGVEPNGIDAVTTSLVTSTGTSTSDPVSSSPTVSSTSTTTTTSSSSSSTTGSAVWYEDCAAVWAALGRALSAGEPGYRAALDRDGDGIACEWEITSTRPTPTPTPPPPPTTTPTSAATVAVAADGGGASGSSGIGPLASTGFAANPALAAGVALVLLGGATVLAARPRRGPGGVATVDRGRSFGRSG
ncbi:MAG TPA: excalibur calcium-binding domain-containing protein [Nakamurella sp.]